MTAYENGVLARSLQNTDVSAVVRSHHAAAGTHRVSTSNNAENLLRW